MAETPARSPRRRAPWVMPVAVGAICLVFWLIFGSGTSSQYSPSSTSGSTKPPPIGTMGGAPPPPWPIDSQSADPNAPQPPWDQVALTKPPAPPPIDLPPDTQTLIEEFVPGTTEWEEVPLVESSSLSIRILPKRYNVVVPRPLVVYLEVIDRKTGKGVAQSNLLVRFRRVDRPDDSWIEAKPVDDGTGEDEKAGDFRYTVTYQPSPSEQPRLFGHVLVEGVVTTTEGGVRRIPAMLIYTKGPRARLTGKWRDMRRDGHLFIEGEVEVEEPGFFTLMGQLVGPDPNRHPIALTRDVYHQLDQGMRWMTLRVWGKAIRDIGVDGPYQLVNVLLTRDDAATGDYEPAETIPLAHVTQPYRAADFSADPWHEPTVAANDVIGPNHPSQKDKPPPIVPESQRDKIKDQLGANKPPSAGSAPTAPPSGSTK